MTQDPSELMVTDYNFIQNLDKNLKQSRNSSTGDINNTPLDPILIVDSPRLKSNLGNN